MRGGGGLGADGAGADGFDVRGKVTLTVEVVAVLGDMLVLVVSFALAGALRANG